MPDPKPLLNPIPCEYTPCGVVFTPRRKWQKYCSKEHRLLDHTQKGVIRVELIRKKVLELLELCNNAKG